MIMFRVVKIINPLCQVIPAPDDEHWCGKAYCNLRTKAHLPCIQADNSYPLWASRIGLIVIIFQLPITPEKDWRLAKVFLLETHIQPWGVLMLLRSTADNIEPTYLLILYVSPLSQICCFNWSAGYSLFFAWHIYIKKHIAQIRYSNVFWIK